VGSIPISRSNSSQARPAPARKICSAISCHSRAVKRTVTAPPTALQAQLLSWRGRAATTGHFSSRPEEPTHE